MKRNTIFVVAVLFFVIIFIGLTSSSGKSIISPPETGTLPSITSVPSGLSDSPAPWPPETDHLRDRLSAIGLPALPQEGTALHIHQHLDISVTNRQITIPEGIGINDKDGFISPLHTHDAAGIIHVESPSVQKFYLGQFFDIWGVRFTDTCLGSYCTDSSNILKVFSNGSEVSSNYRSLELTSRQEIFIYYGSAASLPKIIPSSYSFADGL
ncbi:MAG TPA: hypothetical protein VF828_03315 [Patescibacteria group bacterium]